MQAGRVLTGQGLCARRLDARFPVSPMGRRLPSVDLKVECVSVGMGMEMGLQRPGLPLFDAEDLDDEKSIADYLAVVKADDASEACWVQALESNASAQAMANRVGAGKPLDPPGVAE